MNIKKIHNYAYRINGKLTAVVKTMTGYELFSPRLADNVLLTAAHKIFNNSRSITIVESDYKGENKAVIVL